MTVKRLKELIGNVSDDTEVYFVLGLNDKYEDKENGIFTLKENGESSYLEKKLIFTLKDTVQKGVLNENLLNYFINSVSL